MSVVRVGDAFSARVQRVTLIACRKLFPLCAPDAAKRQPKGSRKVGGTVQATMLYDRNMGGNTLPSGHVQRAAYFQPYFYGQLTLQYTAAGQRPRAHVACEQRPVRQGRCPLLLPQRAPPALVTPVFAPAPAHRFTDSQQNGRPWKEHAHDEFACPGRET